MSATFTCETCRRDVPFSEGGDGDECSACLYPMARTILALARFDRHEALPPMDAAGGYIGDPDGLDAAWLAEGERLRAAVGEAFALDTADRNHPDVARLVFRDRAGEEFVRRIAALPAEALRRERGRVAA